MGCAEELKTATGTEAQDSIGSDRGENIVTCETRQVKIEHNQVRQTLWAERKQMRQRCFPRFVRCVGS
jgi:hypothetical protein